MDGRFDYYIEQINRKLVMLSGNASLTAQERELIQEILDTDIPELRALAGRMTELKDYHTRKANGSQEDSRE